VNGLRQAPYFKLSAVGHLLLFLFHVPYSGLFQEGCLYKYSIMSTSKTPRKNVAFSTESAIRDTEQPLSQRPQQIPSMGKQIFERFDGREVTDDMLCEAAQLFNENYGTWGELSGLNHNPGMPR
jgi:hypothetical protein